MQRAPDRRLFLQTALAVLGSGLASRSFARQDAGLTATRLGERTLLFAGAGGNVVASVAPDGVVMVNGGAQEHSAGLLAAVARETSGARVTTLFNTDWHPDHTGSNEPLARAGARILAHEHTKQYLGADLVVDWQHRTYKALPPAALPAETFYATGTLTQGGERIEYGHLGQAHTDGDIYVFLREANVLVAGDALWVGAYPLCDYTTGGWLGGLVTATKKLLELANDETRVVPGHGAVQTRADLQAQHDMLATLRDRMHKLMRQGMGAEDMLASGITREFDGKWGDPALFLSTSYRGMWLHIRELGGVV
jgi:glyoxylase-like metal-dependent hydrolase (beta-lactamase superfamily II)